MDIFKPDRQAYNSQRAATDASSALVGASSGNAAAENLYRDINTFAYADHKPSEEAIDRVIGKLNVEYVLAPGSVRLASERLLTNPCGVAASTSGRSGVASATTTTRAMLPTSTKAFVFLLRG